MFHTVLQYSGMRKVTIKQLPCFPRFGTTFTIFKNVRNIHGGVLFLVMLQVSFCNFTKSKSLLYGCFTRFLNCTNGPKSRWSSCQKKTIKKFLRSRFFGVQTYIAILTDTPHKNCPIIEFFLLMFFRICSDYGDFLCKSPYSVGIQEKQTRTNPIFEHFMHSNHRYLA